MRKRLRKIMGISLIEFVIVVVLVGILAGAGTDFLYQAFSGAMASYDVSDIDSQAKYVMDRMSRELRSIAGNSATELSNMGLHSITFKNENGEAIIYNYDDVNNVITRNTINFAKHVSDLAFKYYDSNGAETAVSTDVRYIAISLTMTRNSSSVTVSTVVHPRRFNV